MGFRNRFPLLQLDPAADVGFPVRMRFRSPFLPCSTETNMPGEWQVPQ
jgi:hypothetical protein